MSTRFMRSTDTALLCISVGLAAGVVWGQTASTLAGSETCAICHADLSKAFAKSPHSVVETDKKRGNAGHACESCHGPGQSHAETADPKLVRNPAKLTASSTDRVCLCLNLY